MKSSKSASVIQVYNRAVDKPKSNYRAAEPSIKPSVLGSPCLRKIYYSYNNAPKESKMPLKNCRVMALGTAIGRMIHDTLDAEGVVIKYRKPDGSHEVDRETGLPDYEFRLQCPELGLRRGKVDAVVVLDDGLWLVEIKSINYTPERGFDSLTAPKPDHMIQGVLYLYVFNLMLSEGKFAHIPELANYTKANGVRFVYYGKDKSELKEFFVTEADDIFQKMVEKIETIKWFSETDQLPPTTQDWCKTCEYRGRCAANKKAQEN